MAPQLYAKCRIPLEAAEARAAEVVDLLRDCCARIEVAGSIRRRRPEVGDVEIVAIPRLDPVARQVDLFTSTIDQRDRLAERCAALLEAEAFRPRLDVNGRPALGARYKRLIYRDVALDLFVTVPERWGLILLLRTGPAELSKALVTPRRFGGLLPQGWSVCDGFLWHGAKRHAVPEEIDYFRLLGLRWLDPDERDELGDLVRRGLR